MGKDGKIWENMGKNHRKHSENAQKNWDLTELTMKIEMLPTKMERGSTNNTLLEAVANKSAGNGGLNATSATVDTIDLNRPSVWHLGLQIGYPLKFCGIMWYHNFSPVKSRA